MTESRTYVMLQQGVGWGGVGGNKTRH